MENNQNKTIGAFCDCCSCQQNGTESELKNAGWYLGAREEFCPNCND